MFVVKTTSATVIGADASRMRPRKRVPSSRRRNPGEELGSATASYGDFVFGAGALLPVPPVGAGVTGWIGRTLVFGCPVTGGGAVCAGGVKVWSSTERGAPRCAVVSESTNAIARNNPPPHQLIFVSRLPAR